MESFTFLSKSLNFSALTGEVLSNQKFSETKVSSSGGGGYISNGGGYISAPSINSRSILNHEFWVKSENGIEESFNLRGVNIPLREGQLVTIISAEKNGESYPHTLINHSAEKHWIINDSFALINSLIPFPVFKRPIIGGIFVTVLFTFSPFIIGPIVYAIQQHGLPEGSFIINKWSKWASTDPNILLGLGFGFIYALFSFVKQFRLLIKCEKSLSSHIESIVKEKYKI